MELQKVTRPGDTNHNKEHYHMWGDPGRLTFGPLAGQLAESEGIFNAPGKSRGMHPAATEGMVRPKTVPSLNGKFRPKSKTLGPERFGYLDKTPWVQGNLYYLGGKCKDLTAGIKMRSKQAIAHDMTWLYYRMRRDPEHPIRKSAQRLPATAMTSALRDSGAFEFWRDLRPPFHVHNVKRVHKPHTEGPCTEICEDTFMVSYECPLEYAIERSWGEKQDGGTFDNTVHAIAKIQIPENYPADGSCVTVLEWGTPILNWTPDMDERAEKAAEDDEEEVDWDSFQKAMENAAKGPDWRGSRRSLDSHEDTKKKSSMSGRRKTRASRIGGGGEGSPKKLKLPGMGTSSGDLAETGPGSRTPSRGQDKRRGTQRMKAAYGHQPGALSPRSGRKQSVQIGGYGDEEDEVPGSEDDHGLAKYTQRRDKLLIHVAKNFVRTRGPGWKPPVADQGMLRNRRMCCASAGHIWYDG